jgi:hypothetical protein
MKYRHDPNRIDVGFKIARIREMEKLVSDDYSKYERHLLSITKGHIYEENNLEKNSINKYLSTFSDMYRQVAAGVTGPFLLPCSENNSIVDGAHRLALSAYFNLDYELKVTSHKGFSFNADFFVGSAMAREDVETAIYNSFLFDSRTSCFIIWPDERACNVENLIRKEHSVHYVKQIPVKTDLLSKIVFHTYFREKWARNFSNIMLKTRSVGKAGVLRVVFVANDDLQETKERIRKEFNNDQHLLHTPDNREQFLELARVFLDRGQLRSIEKMALLDSATHSKIIKIKDLVGQNVVTGGTVLEMFGIRKSGDLDVLNISHKLRSTEKIDTWNEEELAYLRYAREAYNTQSNLIIGFAGLNFVRLEEVLDFKAKRSLPRDLMDVKLAKSKETGSLVRVLISNTMYRYRYIIFRMKHKLIDYTYAIYKRIMKYKNFLK